MPATSDLDRWSVAREWDAALGKQIFNISEAHAESMVEPHRVTNDFGRKAVSVIAGHVAVHRFTLPPAPQLGCEHDPRACRGHSVTLVGVGAWWFDLASGVATHRMATLSLASRGFNAEGYGSRGCAASHVRARRRASAIWERAMWLASPVARHRHSKPTVAKRPTRMPWP